jgi:hypothetical protein
MSSKNLTSSKNAANQLELFDRFDRSRKFARENLRNEETAPTVH